MQKPLSKQVTINELEAMTISRVLKEEIVRMARSSEIDLFDLTVMSKLQKRYEDIIAYIRRKEEENG